MLKRIGSIAVLAVAVSLAVVATAVARPQVGATAAAGDQCKTVTVGMLAPITGAAATIGGDQLHCAQFYYTQWNKARAHVKIKLVQGDTQLDPAKASTVAQ